MLKSSPRAFRQSLRIEFCEATENDCAYRVAGPAVPIGRRIQRCECEASVPGDRAFRRRATKHSYLPNPVDDLHTKGNNPGVLRGAPMRPFANAIVLKRSLGNSNPANSKRTLDLAAARPMQDMKIAWQPMQIRPNFGHKPKVTRPRH